ncbi:MAG: sodium:calcium antiporter [Candidatus Portnoybacteria bacterium]|nr:sodium:calcium antiporter [Candidatus Portnoybacteria bacterium]
MLWLDILILPISAVLLAFASRWLVRALMSISRYLCWREFVVAFFTIALAASLPNLFVGIISALRGVPEISFGDIIGGNVIDLTLVVFLAVFWGRSSISTESALVQRSALFTAAIAILPLLLVADGILSRVDGLILILVFFLYAYWVFGRGDRFTKIYNEASVDKHEFIRATGIMLVSSTLMLVAAAGIVRSAVSLADYFDLPMIFVGLLIVGLGNVLPEAYFAVVSAGAKQNWMVLGDLMGSVINSATLVLGVVALVNPIHVVNIPAAAVARIFLIVAALLFWIFVKTGRKITKVEAAFLFFIYILFIIIEALMAR